jgi:leucyl aminopeptidase
MEFFVRSGDPARIKTGCLILGVFEGGKLERRGQALDAAADKLISGLKRRGDLPGKPGQTLLVTDPAGLNAQRLLLVGCGSADAFATKHYRRAMETAARTLASVGASDAVSLLEPAGSDTYTTVRHGVEAVELALYRFDELKTGKKEPAPKLKRVGFHVAPASRRRQAERGIAHGGAIAKGRSVARRLANLPANHCTPSYLASFARSLARGQKRMTARLLGEAEMRKLKMGALLSVTAGATEPAKLVILEYKGAGKRPPVVLVGKGITFDSGGISLKPPPGMDEMKFDMGGAAGVLGTMASVAELQPDINVVAIVPTCENMPSGTATHPGDVVRSMSGKTIEILNTDAEGRLILCDALTYAKRYKPDAIIDVATLTGACVIALGHHLTGLMSTSDALSTALLEAGREAEDRAWRMPLAEEYNEELKSNFADFANVAGREGGAVTAACFLSRFTDGVDWAHLDIAGTAWRSGAAKGATGRPVPLLMQYLLSHGGG